MNNDTFFKELITVEEDQARIKSINQLQQAFMDVRNSYTQEYKESLNHILENIKGKMKKNQGMTDAVDLYTNKFVIVGKRDEAREELYNLLAAEMLQTMQALQHTTCEIM